MRSQTLILIAILLVAPLLITINTCETGNTSITFPKKWHGKTKIILHHSEKLSQILLVKYSEVVDIGDPDNDGARDGYKLLGLWWDLSKYPDGVPYMVNPFLARFLYKLKIRDIMAEVKASFEAWDNAVSVELYNDRPRLTFRSPNMYFPDYRNIVGWGYIQPTDIVSIASIWYNPETGEIVDADIILNLYHNWGIDWDDEGTQYQLTDAFDIQNIVTHEAGHLSGLDDIYDSTYWAMTMYGYTYKGETKKISLEPGDIAGIQAVYGG